MKIKIKAIKYKNCSCLDCCFNKTTAKEIDCCSNLTNYLIDKRLKFCGDGYIYKAYSVANKTERT